MTLKGHYTLSLKTRASFGAHHENVNEDRLYGQRRRWSAMTTFWPYKVYADIRGGSLERDVIQQWGNRKRVFPAFGRYVFGILGNEANIII